MATYQVEYRTPDHPEANGRKPLPGEEQYPLTLPLEDGGQVVINMGRKGFENLTQILMDMLSSAPAYSDGSIDMDTPRIA